MDMPERVILKQSRNSHLHLKETVLNLAWNGWLDGNETAFKGLYSGLEM